MKSLNARIRFLGSFAALACIMMASACEPSSYTASPPAADGASLLSLSPATSRIRPDGPFTVALTLANSSVVMSGDGLGTDWERWDGRTWTPTHRLVSSKRESDGTVVNLLRPNVDPVDPDRREFTKTNGTFVHGPFPFKAPDVGPGIYRVCFTVAPADGGYEAACTLIRFDGPGIPKLPS